MRGRSGFTMVDLVVLGLVGVMLIGSGMCSAGNTRSGSNRTRCASNLRQIGLAMIMYSIENDQRFPRTRWEDGATPTAYSAPLAANPFLAGGPDANDITAIAFLLLRTQDLTSSVFICPSTTRQPWQGTASQASNFASEQNLSYSFQNGYADSAAGARWNNTIAADFAIAADMNPGTAAVLTVTPNAPVAQQWQANSLNHGTAGQNVMYGDVHVEWHVSAFAGALRQSGGAMPRDNVYKASDARQNLVGGGGVWLSPVDGEDSVLLPVALSSPGSAIVRPPPGLLWNWVIGGAALVLLVGAFVLLRRLDRSGTEPAEG